MAMIETTDHAQVRELRLERPPANAFNTSLLSGLNAALEEAFRAGPRALVISGRPGMFSAGLDVPELLRLDRAGMLEFWEQFFGLQRRLAGSPLPVAAAITGHSPAGGAVIAMYCDYRVMATGKYRIGLNEVQVGLFPGPIIYGAFRRLVGPRLADQLLSGGVLLEAEEARQVGLVDRTVDAAEVVKTALEWAQHMATLPARAQALTRAMARADLLALVGALGRPEYEAMNEAWFSAETQATMRALVER